MSTSKKEKEARKVAREKLERIALLLILERGRKMRAEELPEWEILNDSALSVQKLAREIEREEKGHE